MSMLTDGVIMLRCLADDDAAAHLPVRTMT